MPFEYVRIGRSAASVISTVAMAVSVAVPTSGTDCSSAFDRTNWRPVR